MKQSMNRNFIVHRVLARAIGCVALPLAVAGCQHNSQVATTQVVVDLGNNQTAVATVVAPESSTPAATSTPPAPTPTPAPAVQPAEPTPPANQTSSEAQQGSGGSGNSVAQASRNVGASVSNGAHEFGTSVVDITTNSVAKIQNTKPESLTAQEIDVDPAMQARDWDQVAATYSSGATVAGPIGFLYMPRTGQNEWRYQFVDPPLFLVNTALLPFAFAKTPPWKPVEWKAGTVEPTYTGVPPLPPE